MLDLAIVVVSIGLVDSLNPSTIGPALYLATAKNAARSVASFTFGVFAVFFLGGLLLALGPGQLLLALIPDLSDTVDHILELVVGAGAIGLGGAAWQGRERIGAHVQRGSERSARSAAVLGAGISAVEFPTAFPYFAVIAAIVGSGFSLPAQIGYVLLFNVAFVTPLLLIILAHWLAAERAEPLLRAVRGWFQRFAGAIVAGILILIGVGLVITGIVGLAT